MKILLLEDEYALRKSIEEFLSEQDYEIHGFGNGDDALDAIYDQSFDLLLLDVNVPGLSGFELLRAIRDDNIVIPTIFLTSMTQIQALEKGYKEGCCDYIRKPFDLMELSLRIQHALRSHYFNEENETITLGKGVLYNTKQFSVSFNDTNVELSKMERAMIELLIKHRGQAVSIEMFQDTIWGEYVDPANVRVQINNLRKKVPTGIIQNRRGIGYSIE